MPIWCPCPPAYPWTDCCKLSQLGTVLYAAQRLPNVVGNNVVVVGQGSAGLWFNFQLRRMGAKQVVALDIESFRLERSQAFGATQTVHNQGVDPVEPVRSLFGGELADVVVEAAGEVDSIGLAVRLVKKYGEILFFGYPRAQTFCFDYEHFFQKCCRATTIVGASNEIGLTSMHLAVELVATGEADAESLITHRVGFADVIDAYENASNARRRSGQDRDFDAGSRVRRFAPQVFNSGAHRLGKRRVEYDQFGGGDGSSCIASGECFANLAEDFCRAEIMERSV